MHKSLKMFPLGAIERHISGTENNGQCRCRYSTHGTWHISGESCLTYVVQDLPWAEDVVLEKLHRIIWSSRAPVRLHFILDYLKDHSLDIDGINLRESENTTVPAFYSKKWKKIL